MMDSFQIVSLISEKVHLIKYGINVALTEIEVIDTQVFETVVPDCVLSI